jgi:hypothetical protein
MTRVTSRNWPQPPLSRYSLFLLSLRTMGYRGEQRSGGRTILRTHGEKLQLARRISATSRNSSVVLRLIRTIGYWGELWRSVAEREGFEPPIGLHLCRISSAVHSTTLPPLLGAKSGAIPSRSGRVLGEDGRPDKAQRRQNRWAQPGMSGKRKLGPPYAGTDWRSQAAKC